MTAVMVVVGGVGSQPALGADLTAVLRFVEPLYPHCIGLRALLNEVALGVIEVAGEISLGEGCQIAHPINKKLCVFRRSVSL